jgi:ATP adenylyltransferase
VVLATLYRSSMTFPDCVICRKHRGEGPLLGGAQVWADKHVLVFHRPPDDSGTAFLGHLFLETRDHVPYLDQLSPSLAAAIAEARRRAAIALRIELNAEHVFAAVIGRGVPHFHEHVFVRYPGTPDDVAWDDSDEWEGARRGGVADVEELAARLRLYFL